MRRQYRRLRQCTTDTPTRFTSQSSSATPRVWVSVPLSGRPSCPFWDSIDRTSFTPLPIPVTFWFLYQIPHRRYEADVATGSEVRCASRIFLLYLVAGGTLITSVSVTQLYSLGVTKSRTPAKCYKGAVISGRDFRFLLFLLAGGGGSDERDLANTVVRRWHDLS